MRDQPCVGSLLSETAMVRPFDEKSSASQTTSPTHRPCAASQMIRPSDGKNPGGMAKNASLGTDASSPPARFVTRTMLLTIWTMWLGPAATHVSAGVQLPPSDR